MDYIEDRGELRELPDNIVPLYKSAILQDTNAIYKIGIFYLNTERGRAVECFMHAAFNGHARSMYYLGWCYENGAGVNKDYATALLWYRRAAKNGAMNPRRPLGPIEKANRRELFALIGHSMKKGRMRAPPKHAKRWLDAAERLSVQ